MIHLLYFPTSSLCSMIQNEKMRSESEWREEELNVHLSKSVSRQPSRNGGLIVSGRFDGTSSAVVAIEKHITVAEWLSLLQTCGLHSRYIVASSQLPRVAETFFDVSQKEFSIFKRPFLSIQYFSEK